MIKIGNEKIANEKEIFNKIDIALNNSATVHINIFRLLQHKENTNLLNNALESIQEINTHTGQTLVFVRAILKKIWDPEFVNKTLKEIKDAHQKEWKEKNYP